MALKKCRECAKEVSTSVKTCPHCGKKNPSTSAAEEFFGGIFGLIVLGFFVWMIFGGDETPLTPAEKAEQTQKEAEEIRKGFHCLSVWDGSHPKFKTAVREAMKDPDSFEHISTEITPVDAKGLHRLVMTFRARNGFGGMNVNVASGVMLNKSCVAFVHSYGE